MSGTVFWFRVIAFAVACACHWAVPVAVRAGEVFQDRVAPILERCLACHHNSDAKGDFSIQTIDSFRSSGFVEAGDAEASHLVSLITPVNGRAEMPKDGPPLSADEIATLRLWINGGAKWPEGFAFQDPMQGKFEWWSYQPLAEPTVPHHDDPWGSAPIDAFVLRRIKEKGLTYSPPADRRTLIRRVTFDLTGLPPSPEEVEQFVGDDNPHAYALLVERLLDSKHYGEHWARHWLDVVKYADTCGYDKDKLRPNAWPYRDYVIRSFNQDKPYGRFVQEQIAGDVLFPGDPDGILGLGFIAAGPWDFIGHVEVPETKIDGKVARNLDRDDMVSNAFNTFCSVTVQCARCHDHKFDPITQADYYGLQALFAAVDRAERPYDLDPEIESRRQTLEATIAARRAELKAVDEEISQAAGVELELLSQQIQALESKLVLQKQPEYGYHSQIAGSSQTEKWIEVDLGQEVGLNRIVLRPCHDEFAGIGPGFGFPVRFKIEVAGNDGVWEMIVDQTQDDLPNPILQEFASPPLAVSGRKVRVTATKLAERQRDYIFALAELVIWGMVGDDERIVNVAEDAIVTAKDSIESPGRWTVRNLTDGQWPTYDDPMAAAQLAELQRRRADILKSVETTERVGRREKLHQALAMATSELSALPAGRMVYAATTHFQPQANFKSTEGKPRAIHVLHRGDVQQPLQAALPGTLPLSARENTRIDPQATDAQRRAALAHWLSSSDNPLVWRSIVNRIWQYHFGQGLVSTPNDFGHMGGQPTHPELLDWLAVQFRDHGQSLKSLHRLIVHSNVYQQSSASDPDHARLDGSNQALWRMPRRRLTAEEIRDSMLVVSGAMDRSIGGPGFYLFQLEKPEHSPHYEYHKFDPADTKSHRRSIYRFVVRSQPDPWMSTLDCADSSQSTPKRDETLTSLQALSLLNSRFTLAMAERMAQRLEAETAELPDQVERAVLLVVQRPPNEPEQQELQRFAQIYGLANLCRFLFNLNEFVFLD